EQIIQRLAPFLHVPPHVPEQPERGCQSQPQLGCVVFRRGPRPFEGRSNVPALLLETFHPAGLRRTIELRLGLLPQRDTPCSMSSPELTLSALLAATAAVQREGIPVMLVLCGLPTILENLGRSKSYSERMFTVEHIGHLHPPEDRLAFTGPAEARGRRFTDQVVEAVLL